MENLAEGSVGNNLSQQTGISAFESLLRGWFGALIFLGLCLHSIYAQSISGTLTGIVTDPSGAVVPQAKVSLKNEGSGDLRRTVSNADGFFTFAAVPAGTYEVSIEAAGFLTYQVSGLNLQAAERRNLDVTMKVGSTTETVSVSAAADVLVPVDSGEKSATLTTKQLQDFSVVGRSAAEFIKIMPGFAVAGTGTENRSNFSGENIGINGNGDSGSQSALNGAYNVNGLPTASLDITADGAHVSDPGCNCATPVNPNTDMIQEFKVLTSNFSAENQKGPAVIQSIAKSGTQAFHGTGYLYARHHSLNSNDWLNNRSGAPKPENKYFFPGGNIGGPVLIPGTNFNKHRDKLFFFTGYEHYFQTLDTGLLRATVPSEAMRAGNFSDEELRKIEGLVGGRYVTQSGNPASRLRADQFPSGIIPPSQIDPTGRAMMNLYPTPNSDPNSNGGFNYVKQIVFDQNSLQWMSRVDYSISDNTKLFVRYNMQRETQKFPIGLWWRNANQVPYPTPILGKNKSDSVTASLTHVFSPTMTNEFIFGYTYIAFPNVFEDPSKVDRTQLGATFGGVFHNNVVQIPSWNASGELAAMVNPGGFEVGGSRGLFADKHLPSIQNNLSKVWGTHTVKGGVYWEYIINNQPANGFTNGQLAFDVSNPRSSGSPYADLLLGRINNYQEQSFNRLYNIGYHTFEFFVQDAWKITRRLSLDLGLRASHFQPWQDREGFGFTVFDYSQYRPGSAPADYSGFSWNKRDPSVPLGGFPSRALYWAPRFGLAYDIFGTGSTVIRGGWGRFYFHTSQFTQGLDASAGVQSATINGINTFAELAALNVQGTPVAVQAVDRNSDRSPFSDSYSFTISQRTPFRGLLEASYVGNQSKNGLNNGYAGSAINNVPYGALFQPGLDPNNANIDVFRPLQGFQAVNIITHGLYQNYNSLQLSWSRTVGRYNMMFNYTYGKSMGIVPGAGQSDLFNLDNNYGVLPYDRRHIFNAAYSIELGSPVRGMPVLGAVVNGWQFSGITQLQSGQNIAAIQNFFVNDVNFTQDAAGNRYTIPVNGSNYQVNSRTVNGTTALPWRPLVTCGLTSNMGERQYVNGSCLAPPSGPGQNGPMITPPVYGPAFFNSDLGLFKNFQMGESRKIQLRFNAYNFLNHPLWSFIGGSTNLKPTFDVNGRQTNSIFGVTTEKQGRRIIQLAVKFYF